MTIEQVGKATAEYPKFEDGRIDYTNERVCFVLNCVVVADDEVLLTKRGSEVIAYPNTINGVSGFIDRTDISIEEQAKLELVEELNAPIEKLSRLVISGPIVQVDDSINREWRVFVVLAEFKEKFKPVTNWENKSATWYKIEETKKLKLMPGFDETLTAAVNMR